MLRHVKSECKIPYIVVFDCQQSKPTLILQKAGAAGGMNSKRIAVVLLVLRDVCLISRYAGSCLII